MHDALSTVITVDTILGAAFFSNAQLNALRGEMNSLQRELNGRIDCVQRELNGKMDSLQRDIREFYAEQRLHDTRISALERAQPQR